MKTFEIWIEGYRATGESGCAYFMGSRDADTFSEAVEILKAEAPDKSWRGFGHASTYWGCRVFDNEADARKEFG